MPVSIAVDGAVQGDPRCQRRRQAGGERPFDEVAEQTADAIGLVNSGQYGVCEEIHRTMLLAGVGLLRGIFRPSCRFNDCKVVADFSALGKDDRGSAVFFLGKRGGAMARATASGLS